MSAYGSAFCIAVGNTIKKLRKEKQLSQTQLSKADDPVKCICSLKTLRRIEQGRSTITARYLDGFLQVFGITHAEFYKRVEVPELILFMNGFNEVWDLLFIDNYSGAEKRMNKLLSEFNTVTGIPLINQSVILYRCVVKAGSRDSDAECIDDLFDALSLTAPHIIESKDDLDLMKVSAGIFSINEYRIINIIATLKEYLGDANASASIYKAVKESLENKALPCDKRNKLLPTVLYNLTDTLTNQEIYNEAVKTGELGLRHGKMVGNHKMDGQLYYSLAKAQYFMGEACKSADNFKRSYASFKAQGRNGMAMKVKELVAKKYDLHIDD